ncbi:MAG: AAA family ATPase [Gammaproteobacteria bacterium]|nr:MAG: AAA family ATPase [Gammaproteobacteria bacterium]
MPEFFIKCISELKNCGVFNGWPKGNIAFGRYNLIYGWNGSGKTTLSRVIRSLEKGAIDPALTKSGASPSFQLQLFDGSMVDSKNLSGWHDKIRAFNSDFVRENINADEAEAQPVYHLGKGQGEALERLKKVRRILGKKNERVKVQENLRKITENSKEGALTDCARIISEAISDRKFDKAKLRKVLDKFKEDETDTALLVLNETEIKTMLNMATGDNDKNHIDVLSFSPKKIADTIHAAVKKTCDTSVTKAAIKELDANAELRKWVEKGVILHKSRDTCAFCASNIEDERLALLDQYFNDAYNNLMNCISAEQDSIKTLTDEIEAVKPTDSSRVYQDIRQQYEADAKVVTDAATAFVAVCKGMNMALTDKKGKFTEIVAVTALEALQEKAKGFADAVNKLNQTIISHNEKFDNFQAAVQEARDKIVNHYSASHYANYKASLDTLDEIDKKIAPLKEFIEKLEGGEAILDAQLREHNIAVDRINELLASFLGRSDIKLVTHEKGYYIEREGERAKHLSEGEKTAVAFSYFISKMEEKEFNIENSVIVVDDPISSLDTNALYAAGSFIRCHLERASQVFILTHNYHFFREIFGWMNRLEKPKTWSTDLPYKCEVMLKCEVGEKGKRVTTAYKLDNTLRKYDSEYLFLFKQLYDSHDQVTFTDSASPDMLAKLMLLPNVARRVLETFILFKFPDVAHGSVINLYNVIKPLGVEVPVEKISILDRLLNRVSHGSEEAMASINMFNLSETPKIIEYVLNFIEQADATHYSGLLRAIGIKNVPTPKAVIINDNKVEKKYLLE